MSDAEPQPTTRRPRRAGVSVVLVLATIVGVLASFAVWSARQLMETDQWVQTSSELLANEEIRDAVGAFAVNALFDNADVEGELAKALPTQLDPLAGPAAGGLRSLASSNAPKLLEQPRVQTLWEQLNRAAHERLMRVINDEAEAVSKEGGEVYLDLGVIVRQLGSELGIGAADRIPEGVARLDVMDAQDLEAVQDGARLLEDAAYVLTVLFLAMLGLAVYLAAGWRRQAVRNCGFVFVAVGVLVLVIRSAVGGYVVDALTGTEAGEPAAEAAWSIATSLLAGVGVAVIGYGVAIVIGAWLAAPGPVATALRRAITPFVRERRTLYPILLAIVILVYAWSPTEGTQRLLPSLVLIGLLVAGAEALRRQSRAEFAEATMDDLSQRWAERFGRWRDDARARIEARRSRRTAAQLPPSPVSADRIAQLERLAELHRAGVLDDEELAEEKRLVRG